MRKLTLTILLAVGVTISSVAATSVKADTTKNDDLALERVSEKSVYHLSYYNKAFDLYTLIVKKGNTVIFKDQVTGNGIDKVYDYGKLESGEYKVVVNSSKSGKLIEKTITVVSDIDFLKSRFIVSKQDDGRVLIKNRTGEKVEVMININGHRDTITKLITFNPLQTKILKIEDDVDTSELTVFYNGENLASLNF
ncbi:hypothetical protein [Mangrovivirga cuniculi]|uniref:Por secretion system C-terminal sorting domain-containing protein n=1 Tax=Mangrovivirga cuniculi TaxID=2715131 RepID=A0A4D7K2B3_9BACT|nr:hypothetical protein [Mangrovivirga cuniculi]QCK15024.1 hypothetical protein DCC35_09840 [Mangrovivirga cuniculi]